MKENFLIIGIETSCDETALALIQNGKILVSLVSSQVKDHARFGGVIPEIAARKHLEVISHLYNDLLLQAGVKESDIDLITVTQGPGLVGALLVGNVFAKGLAANLGVPLLPVNHVHAHVHGALLSLEDGKKSEDIFPCLSLVVSGGHTNLFYMKSSIHFELVSQSLDDACGECFDKVGKMLGLPYPGGPIIEKTARKGDPTKFPMPKMMTKTKTLDFSYSGLKTHVYYLLQGEKTPLNEETLANICAAFQDNAFEQLVRRLKQACKLFPEVKSVLIAGGVAANLRFRELLSEHLKVPAVFPDLRYCSDNAAMVAAYGEAIYKARGEASLKQDLGFESYSRYHELPKGGF